MGWDLGFRCLGVRAWVLEAFSVWGLGFRAWALEGLVFGGLEFRAGVEGFGLVSFRIIYLSE